MGLFGYIIKKGVQRAAIKTIGHATAEVIVAKANADAQRTNAETQKINAEIKKINTTSSNKNDVANGTVKIKPPRPSEDYHDMDALEAAKELLNVGFVNIILKPERRLSAHSKKYGKIKAITLNGNSDFLGVRKVLSTSKIVITYLDYKAGVSEEVYSNKVRLIPGSAYNNIYDVAKIEEPSEEPTLKTNALHTRKKFCIYCGEPITNEKAKFCAICGKQIDE